MHEAAAVGPSIAVLLERAARRLARCTATPQLDGEVLLAHVLETSRSRLRAWPEQQIATEQAQAFLELVDRRAHGSPVAYLTSRREFYSLPLEVDRNVLIPRPETELLVELTLARIPTAADDRILDAGTGSGAVALAIIKERPSCRVVATDVSWAALCLARRNATRLKLDRVAFIRADWLAPFAAASFDLIVSNPPYVRDDDPHLQRGDVHAEPRAALAGGADGLDAIRIIARQAHDCLAHGGWLIVEHGFDQRDAVVHVLEHSGYHDIETAYDLAGHPRAACAVKKGSDPFSGV